MLHTWKEVNLGNLLAGPTNLPTHRRPGRDQRKLDYLAPGSWTTSHRLLAHHRPWVCWTIVSRQAGTNQPGRHPPPHPPSNPRRSLGKPGSLFCYHLNTGKCGAACLISSSALCWTPAGRLATTCHQTLQKHAWLIAGSGPTHPCPECSSAFSGWTLARSGWQFDREGARDCWPTLAK